MPSIIFRNPETERLEAEKIRVLRDEALLLSDEEISAQILQAAEALHDICGAKDKIKFRYEILDHEIGYPTLITLAAPNGQTQKMVINSHITNFEMAGLSFTYEDACDLALLYQSSVLARPYIEAMRPNRSESSRMDDMMHATRYRERTENESVERREYIIDDSGQAALQLKLVVKADSTEIGRLTLSLGMKYLHQPATDAPEAEKNIYSANIAEIELRKTHLLRQIEKMAARQEQMTKRLLTSNLKADALFRQMEWLEPLRTNLAGFMSETTFKTSYSQRIILSPVSLVMEDDNDSASWKMQFAIKLLDANGTEICKRSRTTNLLTSNRELAMGRALDALNGRKDGIAIGFIQLLQEHLQHEWSQVAEPSGMTRMIVGYREPVFIQLDDLFSVMPRFEHTLDIRAEEPKKVSGVGYMVHLSVIRGIGAATHGLKTDCPENLLYKRINAAKQEPVEYQLVVPLRHLHVYAGQLLGQKADGITMHNAAETALRHFIDAARREFMHGIGTKYLGKSLDMKFSGAHETALEIPPFNPSTADNLFMTALRDQYKELFEQELPRSNGRSQE